MLKTVLWIAATCAAVLLALAASRMMNFDSPPPQPAETVEPERAPAPAVEAKAEPESTAKPMLTAEELQIQEDAAATGMTTIEPEKPPPAEPDAPSPAN